MERKDLLVLAGVAAGSFALGGLVMKLYERNPNKLNKMQKMQKMFTSDSPVLKYIADNSLRELSILEELRSYTLANVQYSIMLADPIQVQFIRLFLKSINAKKCLEIGTYTGYNALSCALTIPADGKVYALDINDDFVKHGKPFFEKAKVSDKINIMIAPAGDSLQKLIDEGHAGTFDFAYIDANKTGYKDYYEKSLVLLRKNGVIIFDNMIFSGRCVDLSLCQNERVRNECIAMRKLAAELKDDERVDVSFLNVGDGTYVARKR